MVFLDIQIFFFVVKNFNFFEDSGFQVMVRTFFTTPSSYANSPQFLPVLLQFLNYFTVKVLLIIITSEVC